MKISNLVLLASSVLSSSCLAVIGDAAENEYLLFRPIDPTQEMEGQVIGGVPASPAAWPATLVFRSSGGGCTATVIGNKVVLTAAHCIEHNAQGLVQFESVDTKITCRHHPAYPVEISADFAICFSDESIPNLPFEKINVNPDLLAQGVVIQLLGYGCRAKDGIDKNFGSLFQGQATVRALPTANNYYTRAQGGAAVCFGDSGGGAYASTNPSGTARALFGVNSRGDISENSWLSSTSHPGFAEWARAEAATRGAQICGLHLTAQGCRGD